VQTVEVVTRWGVLAGKVLNFRVLAITTTINSFITRKQMEASKGMGLWKRVESRARRIVDGARQMCRRVAEDPDCMDGSWRTDEAHDSVLSELLTPEYLDVLIVLAKAAQKLLAVQPVLAEASAPCRIFGDLHGQLRDVLLLFHAYGTRVGHPSSSTAISWTAGSTSWRQSGSCWRSRSHTPSRSGSCGATTRTGP